MIIGIDFGNTNSFPAYVAGMDERTRRGGTDVFLLPAKQSKTGIPSTFHFKRARGANEQDVYSYGVAATMAAPMANRRDSLKRRLQMLYDFRTGLYKADYNSLCLAYQRLSLFATNMLDKRIDNLCKSFDNEAFSAHLQGELRKFQGQLLWRVTALEDGFRKLGLIIYRPEPGENYNDVFHAAENVEDDGYLEATVRCCICPGFRTDEQVLCRSAVIVNPITQD